MTTYTIDNDRTFTDIDEAADYMARAIWEDDEYQMTGFERDMLCLDICGSLENMAPGTAAFVQGFEVVASAAQAENVA